MHLQLKEPDTFLLAGPVGEKEEEKRKKFISMIWAIEETSEALLSDFIADLRTRVIGRQSWPNVLTLSDTHNR